MWKSCFKFQSIQLAATEHGFIAKIKNADTRFWGDVYGDHKPETYFGLMVSIDNLRERQLQSWITRYVLQSTSMVYLEVIGSSPPSVNLVFVHSKEKL